MRRVRLARSAMLAFAGMLAGVLGPGASGSAWAQAPANAPAATPAPTPPGAAPPLYNPPPDAPTLAAYRTALGARHLTDSRGFGIDAVRERLAEAETLRGTGRQDEAIARLYELVDDPQFAPFQNDEEGRSALFFLGDSLATAGAYEPARDYLRRVLNLPGAWQREATQARRAVRRLVEIALESDGYEQGLSDLASVPHDAPADAKAEVRYLTGRAREASGDPILADSAYADIDAHSRWWSQATYLRGLIALDAGRLKEAEDLLCKVADPKRQGRTTPVFADQRFFAVRDLARLALGRLAHEESRFDDSRYYYYLVPRDSERLAEALYEAATSRYEKKDYDGALELLDELGALDGHHPYDDEAIILRAYVQLGRCKFDDADALLKKFIRVYEPVRNEARRVLASENSLREFTRSADNSPGALATRLRRDKNYAQLVRRHGILEHQADGLKLAGAAVDAMSLSLTSPGALRANQDESAGDPYRRAIEAQKALEGASRALAEAQSAAPQAAASLAESQQELARIEAALAKGQAQRRPLTAGATGASGAVPTGADLGSLLAKDAAWTKNLLASVDGARAALATEELAEGKAGLGRLDLRLSRLLRRARLGRIESVLGRKRALEIEIEAIQDGILPRDALDSLDAARYLEDNEEYWPFEGDDWPDEYVGGEGLR
jgi:hypothetical protein